MVGQTLGHYKILEKIGAGGMGDVYLAEDTTLSRRVALKVLPPELAESEDRRARFTREAKALAALTHPNIVTVHSVETFIVPADGGKAWQITTESSQDYFPQWSPDGKWIAFASTRGDRGYRLWRVSASGGAAEQVMEGPAYYFRWSEDGKHIYFMGHERGPDDLWALTLEDGTERRVTRFSQKAGSLGDYLAAGEGYLYFTWRNDVGDIWVMDVVTDDKE